MFGTKNVTILGISICTHKNNLFMYVQTLCFYIFPATCICYNSWYTDTCIATPRNHKEGAHFLHGKNRENMMEISPDGFIQVPSEDRVMPLVICQKACPLK